MKASFSTANTIADSAEKGTGFFGALKRGTNRCCLIEVLDRTAATLEPIIRRWILPGTHIISDGWAAYANIENIANVIYTHSIIIRERNFIHPDDPDVHTQLIDITWMRAKKLRRQHGASVHLFASYMAEFIWRSRVGESLFGEFILAVRHLYPL
ncbi:hypothetical protein ElyMa_006557100 [Elysia marginata]|uniref:ISXO2-like transposase domain-containing protein n=1 Tax=Elysia marginata TaxID=1093978 RepID=A0AAV4I9H5_9GAST|nr:hypothetical protein ElyMa_006557100 [Elysia marginata]